MAMVVLGVHLDVVPRDKDLHHRLIHMFGGIGQRRTAMVILGVHLDVVPRDKDLHHWLMPLLGGIREW